MKEEFLKLNDYATLLKLLGDKTRLSIMACLLEKDYCVCDLVNMFDLTQPAISQHLKKLKDMQLVKETRKAQWIYYGLNKESEYYELVQDILKHIALGKTFFKHETNINC